MRLSSSPIRVVIQEGVISEESCRWQRSIEAKLPCIEPVGSFTRSPTHLGPSGADLGNCAMTLPCQHQRTAPCLTAPAPGLRAPSKSRRSAAPAAVQCRAASNGSNSTTRVQASSAAVGERPAAGKSSQEDILYDCVVVGGGISGLTTAQACITEHSDTVKRYVSSLSVSLQSQPCSTLGFTCREHSTAAMASHQCAAVRLVQEFTQHSDGKQHAGSHNH